MPRTCSSTLDTRLRRAIITEYLMVRRWRRDAASRSRSAEYESRSRLDEYKARVEGHKHHWSPMPYSPGAPCHVCGLDYEGHNAAQEGKSWGIFVSPSEPPPWEERMHQEFMQYRLVADCTMEIVQHMRDVLKGGR